MMMFNQIQYLKPIMGSNIVGNAVLVGKYFLTAGHVVSKLERYDSEGFTFSSSDALALYCENKNKEGLYYDYALFNSQYRSPMRLAHGLPNEGEVLTSISLIKQVTEIPSNGVGIFSTKKIESFEPVISKATVLRTIGNFIICDMEVPLAEGQSGSVLIQEDAVFGILHGGVDGKLCVFQSATSIREHLAQQSKSFDI